MKKGILLFLICISSISLSKDPSLKVEEVYLDTKKEVRELHQPMEEKVFELEKSKSEEEKNEEVEKQKKIKEAFILGKARVDFMKERELHLLDLETKAGLDRKKEIETLDKKYSEVLDKYLSIENERELLVLENEIYKDYLERLRVLEETLYKEQNKKNKEN